MRNVLILVSLLVAAGVYTYVSDYRRIPQVQDKTAENKNARLPVPEFSFKDIHGRAHSLSDFKGKVVVLNFWATWCAPCVVEFPQMVSLAKKTQDDTVFLFLSVDEHDDDIKRFLNKKENALLSENIVIGRDEGKRISQDLFQTIKYPETYIITPGGLIAEKIIGAKNWDTSEMKNLLLSLKD